MEEENEREPELLASKMVLKYVLKQLKSPTDVYINMRKDSNEVSEQLVAGKARKLEPDESF